MAVRRNSGEWLAMETRWQELINEGETIHVEIDIFYPIPSGDPLSQLLADRPTGFRIEWTIESQPNQYNRFDIPNNFL